MQKINFTKMHGLGNDFVIIDARRKQYNLTAEQIKLICDRKLGVGCDQLLLIRDNLEASPDYDYIYQIFNCDATEVEQCGNGARCCIKYLINATKQDAINNNHGTVDNPIRLKSINRIITGYAIANDIISICLGIPKFLPEDLPSTHQINPNNYYHIKELTSNNTITYGIVSVGNPHAIIRLNNLDDLNNTSQLTEIAKLIQTSGFFPQGVNVNFYVINHLVDTLLKRLPNIIDLRTYERGCGFTQACGSGAAATVSYGIKQGLLDTQVIVNMRGGTLAINWTPPNEGIIMTGDATNVFSGIIEI